MRRWAVVGLVALLPAAFLFSLAPKPEPKDRVEFEFKRFYVDIYDRIFVRESQTDGTSLLRQKRNLGSETDRFVMPKPAGTFRIFVVGGSVAQFFKIWPSGGSWAERLEALSPGTRFEVINCGFSAYDSYRESLIVDELARYSPDLVVLFSGNNEFYNPVALRWPRLAYLAFQLRQARGLPKLVNPPSEGVPRSQRDAEFEGHLRRMLRTAKAAGAQVAVITLANNLADYAPSGNLPPDLAANPDSAMAHFYRGRALERSGRLAAAMAAYEDAADRDIDPMRCPPARNRIIRRVAAEEGALTVDMDRAFRKVDPRLGLALFYDGVHWLREYNPFVSAEITRVLAGAPGSPAIDRAALERWSEEAARPPFKPGARRDYLYKVLVHAGQNIGGDGLSPRGRELMRGLDRMEPGVTAQLDSLKGGFLDWGRLNSQRAEQQEAWWPRLVRAPKESYDFARTRTEK